MHIVPRHKSDFDACENLARARDTDVIAALPALLEWLQDMNWPVARPVKARIQNLGTPLIEPLKQVLRGNDGMWKYFVIQDLLPHTATTVLTALVPDLLRLADKPTADDEFEEANLAARELLDGMNVRGN